ncbi:MAG: hypothetical protein KJ583_04835 [Nanoarchaeota archaeon]|nr:hypothetical protein [Nanoarchaeota archaeon]MBU1270536.1 hypothetical protein [Nanoarchaeota archaeon]MBU1604615.1 hypothetical protein [Nanoarchaeota archaeon]MBU2442765.1 hypothetical protein [Nanoarchaeota archaeon]
MVNVTLSIPQDLKSRMDNFAEMNWSAIAREAFNEKIKDLELIKKFKAKSTFTEEDALRLGKELNANLAKRRKI